MGENLFYLSLCHGNTLNVFVNINLFNHDIRISLTIKNEVRGEWATLCYPSFIVIGDVMSPKRRGGDFEMVIIIILKYVHQGLLEISKEQKGGYNKYYS
jgi:hypothetical protein